MAMLYMIYSCSMNEAELTMSPRSCFACVCNDHGATATICGVLETQHHASPAAQHFRADLAAWTSMAAPRSSALLLGLRRFVFSPSLSLRFRNKHTVWELSSHQGNDTGACKHA